MEDSEGQYSPSLISMYSSLKWDDDGEEET